LAALVKMELQNNVIQDYKEHRDVEQLKEQVEKPQDGISGESKWWDMCNAETEKNACGLVIDKPAVYFTTITDFYLFRRINKCHNLVNPCHICAYLQDPLLMQQFLLAAVFSMIQNRCIEFCC
jgi:hypothetical protein